MNRNENCRISIYDKREMAYQKYLGSDLFAKEQERSKKQSDSYSEDDYEKCDHEYTIFSKGFKTCLTCGLQVE